MSDRAAESLATGTTFLETEVSSTSTPSADAATRTYVRGSGLLLGGRFISIFLNLAVQILTVRYLAKSDYGAFAYALGIVSIGSSLVLAGLGKAVPRFVPIYQERGDHSRVFGTIALAVGTIWGLGVSLIVLLIGLRGFLSGSVITDPLSLSLLLILIALAPINAFDHLLQHLVAVFVSARAIFFRRYILGPGLKLLAVITVIFLAGDVYLLAYGYLIGGVVGIWLYVAMLLREWRNTDLLQHMHPRRIKLPARELFGFSIPLLSSELPVLLRGSIAVILLEYFQSTTAVAEYRAVYPIAGLNLIVFHAYGFLFVPLASRMFARGDRAGVNRLYWQTSLWIMVLTFPVFAVTCSLATPVTVLLFGAEYAAAGSLLAILAVGYYFNATLGFNAATLHVYGKVRYAVASDILAAATFLALCLLLIPDYGAVGAAVGTTVTLVVHNIFNHVGLWVGGTGIRLLEWRFVSAYLTVVLLMVGLLTLQWLYHPPIYLGLALAAGVSLILIRVTRHVVSPKDVFPELLRISLLRRLLT